MISGVHTDGFFHSDSIPPIRTVLLTSCTYLVITSLESIQVEKASRGTPPPKKKLPSVRNESILKNWRMSMSFLRMKAWSFKSPQAVRPNDYRLVHVWVHGGPSGQRHRPRGAMPFWRTRPWRRSDCWVLTHFSLAMKVGTKESVKKSPTRQIQGIVVPICLTCSKNKKTSSSHSTYHFLTCSPLINPATLELLNESSLEPRQPVLSSQTKT